MIDSSNKVEDYSGSYDIPLAHSAPLFFWTATSNFSRVSSFYYYIVETCKFLKTWNYLTDIFFQQTWNFKTDTKLFFFFLTQKNKMDRLTLCFGPTSDSTQRLMVTIFRVTHLSESIIATLSVSI